MAKCPYHDPFSEKRAKGPILETEFDGDPVAMILGLKDVRKAARDWKTFSSDAPFRVPIPREEDLRSIRQFPIESDPPEHAEYRKIVEPAFNRPNEPEYQARMAGLIHEMISESISGQSIEAVSEFALPLQSRALTFLLGVPESEARSWIKWGVHVLRDGDGPTKGKEMEQYCKEAFVRSSEWGEDNFFSILNQATFQGRLLTDDEKLGFANLAFAGGRDTVINTVCLILAHFAHQPDDLERLREEPELVNCAGGGIRSLRNPAYPYRSEMPGRYRSPRSQGKGGPTDFSLLGLGELRRDRIREPRGNQARPETQPTRRFRKRHSQLPGSSPCPPDHSYLARAVGRTGLLGHAPFRATEDREDGGLRTGEFL